MFTTSWMCSMGEVEVSPVKSGRLFKADKGILSLTARSSGLPPLKVAKALAILANGLFNKGLFKVADGFLGYGLSTGGVDEDLGGGSAWSPPLTRDNESLSLLLLELEAGR